MLQTQSGGIEQILDRPDAPIDPKGKIDVEPTTARLPEQETDAETRRLQDRMAEAAIDAAMYGYMAQRLGQRVVHMVQGPQPAGNGAELHAAQAGLFDAFRTTHSAYNPRTKTVVSKPVAKARPMRAKPGNTKPEDKKKKR